MDFDADLTQIQGALLTADNTYNFKNFNHWEDKPTVFKSIIESLYKILLEKGYLFENGINTEYSNDLRKITMFLIFNADLRTLDELVNSDDIGHVIWVTPTIPKYLLLSFILGLHLKEYYCEAIRHSCPKLSLELSRIATQYMMEMSPNESIIMAKKLITSIYSATIRFLNNKEGFHKYILNGYYENIYELIKYYVDPPNKKQMLNWRSENWYVHNGETFYNLFEMMIICFNIFLKKRNEDTYENIIIFTHTYGKSNSDSSSSENFEGVENNINLFLKKYNSLFTDTMRDLSLLVNIDTYCAWSEYPSINDPTKSLQKAVGELAYNLHSLMANERNNLNDDAIALLVPIMSKPLELTDIIKQADKALILEKANEPSENQRDWLIALFNNECFFTDKASMDCFRSHLHLLNDETKLESFRKSVSAFYKLNKYQHIESIKTLTLACFSEFSIEHKRSSLLSVFTKFHLGDLLEAKNFDAKCVEVLNKFVEFNENILSEFFNLFLQNPYKLYLKVFDRCIKNSQAIGLLDVLRVFEDMHTLKYGSFDPDKLTILEYGRVKVTNELQVIILLALKNTKIKYSENNIESRNLVVLTKGLINKKILSDIIVIFRYLMDKIDKHLSDKSFHKALAFIKCLREVFVIEDFLDCISLMIVRIAQIMEMSRWNISSYSLDLSEVLDVAINFQITLIAEFMDLLTPRDLEYQWIISKLSFLSPLNMYYFRTLLPSHMYNTLLGDVKSYTDLCISLCYILPRSTLNEWKIIFDVLNSTESPVDTFRTFCIIMSDIASSAVKVNTVRSYACFEHCCKNLAIVLQDHVLPSYDHAETEKLIKEVIYVINKIPVDVELRCFNMFLTPISNMIDSYLEKVDSSIRRQQKKYISDIFLRLQNDNFTDIIKKMLRK